MCIKYLNLTKKKGLNIFASLSWQQNKLVKQGNNRVFTQSTDWINRFATAWIVIPLLLPSVISSSSSSSSFCISQFEQWICCVGRRLIINMRNVLLKNKVKLQRVHVHAMRQLQLMKNQFSLSRISRKICSSFDGRFCGLNGCAVCIVWWMSGVRAGDTFKRQTDLTAKS